MSTTLLSIDDDRKTLCDGRDGGSKESRRMPFRLVLTIAASSPAACLQHQILISQGENFIQ